MEKLIPECSGVGFICFRLPARVRDKIRLQPISEEAVPRGGRVFNFLLNTPGEILSSFPCRRATRSEIMEFLDSPSTLLRTVSLSNGLSIGRLRGNGRRGRCEIKVLLIPSFNHPHLHFQ